MSGENTGPSYCRNCGAWPANRRTRLCNTCDDILYVSLHPVPLPKDPKMRRDILMLRALGALRAAKEQT